MGQNTGLKVVLTLRKYVDGQATNETKVNASNDPDYIAPYIDATACPINDPTPTTTTSTTTTTTTLAPGETTTTTTAAPSPCYTYYVENRNRSQGPNIYYTYIDCNGVLQGEFVVPADSETLEFCAEEGSVVISGTGGGYVEVAESCLENPLPTTTTTTGAPTTTTTTEAPACATYMVENYHQFDNMYYKYNDCNGTNLGPFTIPPDSSTPDFCAQVDSVVLFGTNTAGDIVKVEDNCTV